MELLLLENKDSSYCKILMDFCSKTRSSVRHNERKNFCTNCLQCFRSEEILTNHREVCLKINGKRNDKMP